MDYPSNPYDLCTGPLTTGPLPGDDLRPIIPNVTRAVTRPADAPPARRPTPKPVRMTSTPPMPRGGGANKGVRSPLGGEPTK